MTDREHVVFTTMGKISGGMNWSGEGDQKLNFVDVNFEIQE